MYSASRTHLHISFYQAHYGPVSGGGVEAGIKGAQEVVRAGRIGLGGDVDGLLGGRTGRGWGGDGQDRYGDRLNQWGGYYSKRNLSDRS